MFDAEIFDARKFITFKLPLGQRSEVLFTIFPHTVSSLE